MIENNEKKQEGKEKNDYICFDDTPEDLSDYLRYLKGKSQKSNQNNS